MVTGNNVLHERNNLMTRRTVGVVQGKLFEIKEKNVNETAFQRLYYVYIWRVAIPTRTRP
jgi:hypothetical protein